MVKTLNINTNLLKAYLQVKKSYALANSHSGVLDSYISQAIVRACDDEISARNKEENFAEPFQSLADSTVNANVNALIINKAEKLLNGKLDQNKAELLRNNINLHQQTALTFCFATRLAVLMALSKLEPSILNLERLLRRDALAIAKVLKVSSAHMQMTTGDWGKKLNAFAIALESALRRLKETKNYLLDLEHMPELGLQEEQKIDFVVEKSMLGHLAENTGYRLKGQDDIWQNTFVVSDLLHISSSLKDLALVLSKVAMVAKIIHTNAENVSNNDPAQQIQTPADSLNMAAYQVIGNNVSLTFLAQSEQLQNVFLTPVLSHNLLAAIDLLRGAVIDFEEKGFPN